MTHVPTTYGYVIHTKQDLNKDPTFPFDDERFDVVTCVVSVDYLTKPIDVFKEINRVLRPGGKKSIDVSLFHHKSCTLSKCCSFQRLRSRLDSSFDPIHHALHTHAYTGLAIMSFSNRCFPTKAIQLWLETGMFF